MLKFALTTGLVLAGVMSAHAADLIVDEAPASMDTTLVNSSIYVQLLGGVAAGLDTDFDGDIYETELGYAIAAAIGVEVMDGVAVEADVFATRRSYKPAVGVTPEDTFSSVSLMANAKFTAPVSEMFSLYGAVGLGVIKYHDTDTVGGDYSGLGYQLIVGATAEVADNISIVGELRYQNTFEPAAWEDDDTYSVDAPTMAAMVGVKLAF